MSQETNTTNAARDAGQIIFGERRKEIRTVADVASLMGKRVLVCLRMDCKLVGTLGRNSFSNQTLCLTTGEGAEQLYGKFFFEPHQAEWISEINPD